MYGDQPMPKTNTPRKPVRSFRLSQEGIHQLQTMAQAMGRSESDVIEIALDRMYREEIRFNNRFIHDKDKSEENYRNERDNEGAS
jgi:DNA-binding PadR family transcriptional regulator